MIRSLIQQSVIYGVSTILARGAQVVTLLVLPLILRPNDYGALQMLLTIGILANFVVPLEISQGLARYFPGAVGNAPKLYSSSAWWFTAGALALFLIVIMLFAGPLCEWILHDSAYLRAFRLGAVLIALNAAFFFMQSQCRWQFDLWGYTLLSVVYALGTMAGAIGFGLALEPPIDGVLIGQVLGASIAVLLGAFRLRRSFAFTIDKDKLKEMLRFSLPLVPANVALFAGIYGSRLILNSEASLREVGIFTYASQIGGIAMLAILGVQSALTPMIMAHHDKPETPSTIARLFEGFTALALLLCLALGLFAREFIQFFGNQDYSGAAALVILLAPATLMTQMYIFAPGFAVAKKTMWQLWVSLVGGAVSIIANLILIRFWGVFGAAWATLLAATTFLACWISLGQRLYPIPIRWRSVMLGVAASVTLAAVALLTEPNDLLLRLSYKTFLILAAGVVYLYVGLIPATLLQRAAETLRQRLKRYG